MYVIQSTTARNHIPAVSILLSYTSIELPELNSLNIKQLKLSFPIDDTVFNHFLMLLSLYFAVFRVEKGLLEPKL